MQGTLARDILIVIVVVIALLMLREGFNWFFKTNHAHSQAKKNEAMLQDIVDRLDRNNVR